MRDIHIECITGGPFETNAYLVADPATRHCAVVDPGYGADHDWKTVIDEGGYELESIVVTHGHIDHTCGVAALSRAYPNAPIWIHRDDAPMLAGGNIRVAQMFGLPPFETAEATAFFEEGVPFRIGGATFQVLHVPGHCPGHVALHCGKHLISGDVLFLGSIGRTDLPGGNFNVLADSIVRKLLPLADDTIVYPGHGPITTIGQERATNPFVLQMIQQLA